MKNRLHLLTLAVAITLANAAHAQVQGPSTGSTPYALPVAPGVTTYSIATVDNTGANPDDTFARLGGGAPYSMTGVPDGLGAFQTAQDVINRTFTVLMNHEIQSTAGIIRAHGSVGSFVSQWTINKDALAVVGVKDLIQNVNLWNGAGYTTFNSASPIVTGPASAAVYNAAIGRLCSADLPAVSAFSNGLLGTTERIFMSGEEIGNEGRVFAHIVTGANAGTSYELPRLGKFSWENAVASPFQQNKTIVIGLDDTTPGQTYVYVGNKTNVGTEVDKAGLTNGSLYGIKIAGFPLEDRTNSVGITKGNSTAFTLAPKGDVSGLTGAQQQASSVALGIAEFLRPEDGAWDTQSDNRFYFVTTDRYDQVKDGVGAQVGRSRLYALDFADMANPENGGTIKLLLDGAELLANGGLNMMDNIAVDMDGNVLIVEDVGGQAHNGKLARYNPTTGVVDILAKHDPARFGDIGSGPTAPFSNDEEFSGVIDITEIMADSALANGDPSQRWYLFDDQAHYSLGSGTVQVEGGQILIASVPEPTTVISLVGGVAMLLGLRRRRA